MFGTYARNVIAGQGRYAGDRKKSKEEQACLPGHTPFSIPKEDTKLVSALLGLCGAVEKTAKGEDGEQLRAMVLTSQIRRVIQENT